jgi:hypothetical protein
VSSLKYELGFYISEDEILHSDRRENLKSYVALTGWTLKRRRNVFSVRYDMSFHIIEGGILPREFMFTRRILKRVLAPDGQYCRVVH